MFYIPSTRPNMSFQSDAPEGSNTPEGSDRVGGFG